MKVARVVVGLSLDREFDYRIPAKLLGQVRAGSQVLVPFNESQRKGYVVGLKGKSRFPNLKEILEVVGSREQIPPALLKLADWISTYYCCAREAAVHAMLPAVVRGGRVKPKQVRFACLPPKPLRKTKKKKEAHNDGEKKGKSIEELTTKQRHALETLMRVGSLPVSELCEMAEVGPSVIKRLEEAGAVVIEERTVNRDPFREDLILPTTALKLTPQQEKALGAVVSALDSPEGDTFLLHGITGSGKTEIYLQAIAHCLESGRDAIVLVPEISLTPQTCTRFRARFGERVSVLHSGLSDGERFDEWTKINEGKTRIVVGARSALFAPFRKLGLIVVDEEHESTYKQDESPRYNARDVAVVRGRFEKATVVLGSATPALESYHNCKLGKYKLLELTERVDNCRLPVMEVVDMRDEAMARGGPQMFSRTLEVLVKERLSRGEQTIFFLNRRGFASRMLCTKCGFVAECPDCSATYTYHRRDQMLVCHLCGRMLPAPEACPTCGDKEIRYTGLGTEKIETAARIAFPQATIARMDSDTMTTRNAYRQVLAEFGAGRINILIGTQMIAKGLHFPNVTLVGVIFADMSLHIPDFRAGERTFQLLTQVAGRAGRGERAGRVVVQTYTPFHNALQRAVEHDYKAFYEDEMPMRSILGFPPETHMAAVHFRGEDDDVVRAFAAKFTEDLAPQLDEEVEVMGPQPAQTAKVRGKYRHHLFLRGGNILRLGPILRRAVVGQARPKGVEVYIDIDPYSIL